MRSSLYFVLSLCPSARESVNVDYWTGLLDWTTALTSIVGYCPDHVENASHGQQPLSQAAVVEGIVMRISQMLNNRVMRLRSSVSVLLEITHTNVAFVIWHMEAHWPTMVMEIRIADLMFNYFIYMYTRTYIWSGHNKLLASLTRAVSFLFW